MTKKTTNRAKTKAAVPARTKKQIQKKGSKGRWQEEAVIHQDLFFAEAPAQP